MFYHAVHKTNPGHALIVEMNGDNLVRWLPLYGKYGPEGLPKELPDLKLFRSNGGRHDEEQNSKSVRLYYNLTPWEQDEADFDDFYVATGG